MENLGIFISLLIVLGISLEVNAGCAETLQNDGNFQACFMGYSQYIADGAQRMDPNDPNGMINLMCSKTGKEKVKCAINYIKTCPALMTTGDSAVVLNSLQTMESMGGFEQMCSLISLISGTGPSSLCSAVSQCIEAKTRDVGSTSLPDGRTPFSSFQFYTGYICGHLKKMLECFKDTGDQCSNLLNDFEERMDIERTNVGSDVTFPTFKEIKKFTLQECSKLPADFSSNMCVKENLDRDKFVECFQNISEYYPTKENQASCEQYRAGHQCVSITVGKNCGDQYTKAIEKLTPLFMVGIPRNCRLKASDTSDSSHQIRMSSPISFLALVLSLSSLLYL